MTRQLTMTPAFVEEIPDQLDPGVLYVSITFATSVHACCCGCAAEVVTPLHPVRWSLVFDGETVSLRPSVGSSSLPCRSHYFIDRNRVVWLDPLTDLDVDRARTRDLEDLDRYFDRSPDEAASSSSDAGTEAERWWRRLLRRSSGTS
jgi:hypothetical protein